MVNDVQRSVYNGRKIKLEIFGSSHAPEIGVKASGLDGQTYDKAKLQEFMDRRKAGEMIQKDKSILKRQVFYFY